MICEKCGSVVEEGQRFCGVCGSVVNWNQTPAPAPAPEEVPQVEVAEQPAQEAPVAEEPAAPTTQLRTGVYGEPVAADPGATTVLSMDMLTAGYGQAAPAEPVAPAPAPAPIPQPVAPAPTPVPVPQPVYSAFEGGTAVPLIVSWPAQVKASQESQALVSHIDLLASLGNLVGARLPRGAAADSRDALSTLLGRDRADRPYVVEQANDHTLSIRTRDWKYITPSNSGPMITWGPKIETGYLPEPQLFDMRKVTERENEAAQHPDVVANLQSALEDIRAGKAK